MLRKSHFDEVPLKPQRVYQEMNEAFGRDTCYVTTIGLSQIAAAQLLPVYNPRNWIHCDQAGPLGWRLLAGLGVRKARSEERRVGTEGVRTCRPRLLPHHSKTKPLISTNIRK